MGLQPEYSGPLAPLRHAPGAGRQDAHDSLTVQARGFCRDLLEGAVRAPGLAGGAVFSVDPWSDLALIVITNPPPSTRSAAPDDFGLLQSVATQALETGRVSTSDGAGGAREALALPITLGGQVVGVLAVSTADGLDLSVEAYVRRLEPVLFPLGLAVDRLRIGTALEDRGAEIAGLRRQLGAYAVDFRSTYLSERARSDELAAALGELEATYRATVHGLAVAVEAKDECTGGHLQRVTRYGMTLTRLVAPEHAEDPQFEYGFLLHDIGKLTVPDGVLTKPGSLTPQEWELIRLHPASGGSILDGISFLDGAREIVYAHHERWDGQGYPRGLAGFDIPLGALIFPLCDAFDAMTSDRPYRMALPVAEALDELRRGSGTQFWPAAVEAFLSVPLDQIEALRGANGERLG